MPKELELIMYNEIRSDLTKLANKYDDAFHGSADIGEVETPVERAYCVLMWQVDEKIRELYRQTK